jgi:hypothetical protein
LAGLQIIMIGLPNLRHIHICGTASEEAGGFNQTYFADIRFEWKDATLPINLQTMAIESAARLHVFDDDMGYYSKYSHFRWASITTCTVRVECMTI